MRDFWKVAGVGYEVVQLQRVTREGRRKAFHVGHSSGLPSLTRLSNFDTIKTERINLHPPPTPSARSRRDASGEEMVLKKGVNDSQVEKSSSFGVDAKGRPLYGNPLYFGGEGDIN